MTICDKINEVGETLQENLNGRGVSCTFGTGTGESTVLEMVEMVNGTNFKGSSDVNLKISANRPYLLENETTDVIVKLEDGLCEPLANKSVTVSDGTNTVNGVTDEKGEFALYDVSITDDTTFTASYGTETATCLVEYCTYVNYLVDNEHDANSYYGTGTVTYDKVGAKLDATTFSSSNYQLNFRPIDDVVTVPYEVKFELLDKDTSNFRVYFYNTNFSGSAIASGTIYTQNQQPTLIRFVVTSSGITRYVGNTSTELAVSTSIASEVGARFGYWQPTTGKVKIRNFRIKPL